KAIVMDERLAALRAEPSLSARLVRRLGRGRVVQLLGARRTADGVLFERVAVTRRTRGWVQRDALASPFRAGDDQRLFDLIRASRGFERIARAQLFLRHFARSPHRPAVLLLLAEAAERVAEDLSRDALRRLNPAEMTATGAPAHSYFMNYVGLDRYNRQGIRFVWDGAERRFRYDGAGWRELLRRYPQSPEAEQARRRLARD
ncbi:hypothetical protein, partial [Pyrinomonas sp.]|uniref:hypothetical protein n=1 Tax=Pyrinomonas sp. TaxID=2080306 RepID=UPI003324FD63